jgi:hypothetical protein
MCTCQLSMKGELTMFLAGKAAAALTDTLSGKVRVNRRPKIGKGRNER